MNDDALKQALANGDPVCVDGVLYNMHAEVGCWVQERLGGGLVEVPFYALGIIYEGHNGDEIIRRAKAGEPVKLAAGAYFFNHQDHVNGDTDVSDIMAAVACESLEAARPDVIRRILDFPFGQLQCRRISFEIEEGNERAIRQVEKLGAELEGVKKHMGSKGSDVMLFGLYRHRCPLWQPQMQEAA